MLNQQTRECGWFKCCNALTGHSALELHFFKLLQRLKVVFIERKKNAFSSLIDFIKMISAIIFLLQIQIYNKLNEIKLEFLAVGLRHLHNSQLSATFTPAVTSEFY